MKVQVPDIIAYVAFRTDKVRGESKGCVTVDTTVSYNHSIVCQSLIESWPTPLRSIIV
jgi:hypothetical protein